MGCPVVGSIIEAIAASIESWMDERSRAPGSSFDVAPEAVGTLWSKEVADCGNTGVGAGDDDDVGVTGVASALFLGILLWTPFINWSWGLACSACKASPFIAFAAGAAVDMLRNCSLSQFKRIEGFAKDCMQRKSQFFLRFRNLLQTTTLPLASILTGWSNAMSLGCLR